MNLTRSFNVAAPCALLVACALALAGCGGRAVKLVPVSGTVTLDGAAMPDGGSLFFSCVEAAPGADVRPGSADFAADGRFAVQTFEPGDGLTPGRYRVVVHCWEVSPNEEGSTAKSFIPAKYGSADSSGLELNVDAGAGPITFDIALTSK
ncbi:MAG: hypothetical protein KDA41_20565 [Planctomycetales bacterium]|nr:hypothetical protein [Planctomycetales bacterium]